MIICDNCAGGSCWTQSLRESEPGWCSVCSLQLLRRRRTTDHQMIPRRRRPPTHLSRRRPIADWFFRRPWVRRGAVVDPVISHSLAQWRSGPRVTDTCRLDACSRMTCPTAPSAAAAGIVKKRRTGIEKWRAKPIAPRLLLRAVPHTVGNSGARAHMRLTRIHRTSV